jgi:hypothetical protein
MLSQLNLIHILTLSSFEIYFNIQLLSHLRLSFRRGLFHTDFTTKTVKPIKF